MHYQYLVTLAAIFPVLALRRHQVVPCIAPFYAILFPYEMRLPTNAFDL